MLKIAHPLPTHEDVFIERYDRLLTAASTLTAGDREAAQDLVHEAFLHFALARPPLHTVADLDGYLFVTIRNLHISRIRRASRVRHDSLDLVDFDSAALGLRTAAVASRLEALDELGWICEYVIARRHAVRAGSAFLLRYFLSYVPSEIARLLQSPPVTVRKLLYVARADVRQALHRRAGNVTRPRRVRRLDDLRRMILEAPVSDCPPRARLVALYAAAEPIDVSTLAHIVCCRTCLDRVNTTLGLPRLADRERDSDDESTGGPDGGPLSKPPRPTSRRPHPNEVAEIREHCPKELRILVNGLSVAKQRVAGPENEQVVRLNAHEPVTFLEVLTEQDMRLLLLNAQPLATGMARQMASVTLSDERTLEAVLDLSDLCPTVQVTYRDPHFAIIGRDDLRDEEEGIAREVAEVDREGEMRRPPNALVQRGRLWMQVSRLFRASPWRRRALQTAGALVVIWLLFFTPGTTASAAELAYRALVQVVGKAWEWLSPPAALPSVSPPRVALERPKPASRDVPTTAAAGLIAHQVGPLERARAELMALSRLQRVEAYLGQEVRFERGSRGRVRLEAVVDDDERRAEVAGALRPVAAEQPVDLEVLTAEEVASRGDRGRRNPVPEVGRASPRPVVKVFEFDRNQVTAGATVTKNVGSERVARAVVNQWLERSRRASQHAWALHYVSERYGPALVDKMSTFDRDVLTGVIVHHAREFDRLVELIAEGLGPLWGRPGGASDPAERHSSMAVWQLTERVLVLNRARDEALRRAFVVGAAGDPRGLETPLFWQAMQESREIARQLQREPRLTEDR